MQKHTHSALSRRVDTVLGGAQLQPWPDGRLHGDASADPRAGSRTHAAPEAQPQSPGQGFVPFERRRLPSRLATQMEAAKGSAVFPVMVKGHEDTHCGHSSLLVERKWSQEVFLKSKPL